MSRSDDEDGVPCKTPSPRSSASQAPPNPRHNADEPPPRINLRTAPPISSHPFKGLSRKFMPRKDPSSDHKRRRSVDIGPAQGVFDTANVRERVRLWQQSGGGVVLPGDVVELPPISPATPTPGSRRGMPLMPGIDMSLNGIASTMGSDPHPLTPPRMPAVRDEWSSASEDEREAQRQRTRSKERERKLRRKDRGQNGEGTPDRASGLESGGGTPARAQTNSPATVSYFDDGIRVAPLKPKRRTSGSRRKKREKASREIAVDETDDGGVTLGLGKDQSRELNPGPGLLEDRSVTPAETATELKTPVSEHFPNNIWDVGDGIRVTPMKPKKKSKPQPESSPTFEVEVEFLEPEPEPEPEPELEPEPEPEPELEPELELELEPEPAKSTKSERVEIDAWDFGDGIRIYASKPSTPVKFSERKKSVRQSAKSVRSRKEQFEADLKKEKAAQKAFDEMIREHEGDDEGEGQPLAVTKEPMGTAKDIEGSTVVEDKGSAVRKWEVLDNMAADSSETKHEAYDDGIRVRPLKTKTGRRKKGPETVRSNNVDDFNIEDSVGSETTVEPPSNTTTPKPPKFTESAPATPTGVRSRRDIAPSTPFSVKDRVQKFQTGDMDPVSHSHSHRKSKSSPKQAEVLRAETSPTSQNSQRRPRTKYSPTRDREERRAERRELRKQLREDSEKFRTLAARTRSASPAPQQESEKPLLEESKITREKSVAKEKTVLKDSSMSKERPAVKESLVRELLFTNAKPKSPIKEKPLVQAKSLPKEKAREPPQIPARPRKTTSLSLSTSVDDLNLKKERSHTTPLSSSDSLPLSKDRTSRNNRSAPALAEEPSLSRRRSRSTPPDSRSVQPSTQKTSPPLDFRSISPRKKEPTLVPKLSHVTSTIFKAFKEEFKGVSVRTSTLPLRVDDPQPSATESESESEESEEEVQQVSTVKGTPKKTVRIQEQKVEDNHTTETSESDLTSDSETDAESSKRDVATEQELAPDDNSSDSEEEELPKESPNLPLKAPIVEVLKPSPKEAMEFAEESPKRSVEELFMEPPSFPIKAPSVEALEMPLGEAMGCDEEPPKRPVEELPKESSSPFYKAPAVEALKAPPRKAMGCVEEPPKSPVEELLKESSSPLPKAPAAEALKAPPRKAMGCVEEPPKRSVKELVLQLEVKPGKSAPKAPPPEPLMELLEGPVKETDGESIMDKVEQPAEVPIKESLDNSVQQSVIASVKEPVKEPVKETVKEPVREPAKVETVIKRPAQEPLEDPTQKVVMGEPTPMPPPASAATAKESVEEPVVAPSADDPEPEKETPQQEDDKDERKIPVLQEIPDLLLPKRSLRGTTAPPRPKSVHSMIGSDGSFTPTGSVCGDSLDGDSFIRNPSDASTVKPLQFKKAGKPQIVEIPQPPGPKDKVERKDDDEIEDWYNPDVSVSLKRKYTKHADLISILSVPKSNKSLRSAARSRRSKGRKHVETLTVEDLLKEFSTEEVKYLRELRTLVEDVVPILFQTVLGRADDDLRRTSSISSIGTAGTFATASSRSSRGFSSNPTRPIVDMGISLERLRTLHERIPTGNVDQILTWAGDAKRVYEEYLSVWRMGFQDVVVTMTPDEDDYDRKDANIRKELEILHGTLQGGAKNPKYEGDPSTWALPPPPNMEEVKDEKVDVAFLLKRPLVRLKLLAKLFKRIDYIKSSPMAASLSTSFHALVTIARRKISEEKARIEDEAAAALDVSKVYDIHTLLPRRDICLDQKRRVKARDCFTMRFYHSSDENIERTIELILRDPQPRSKYSEGEILFVEVDESSSKWLLFPPVPLSAISARTGDAAGEIVVMVRGLDQEAQEWREVMALASSTAAGFEWVQMLGLIPIPPEGPFSKEPIQPAILETVIEESIAPSRHYSPVKPRRRRSRHAPKLNVFDFLEPETKEGSENIPTEESEIDPHPTSISAETAAEEDLEDLEEPKPDPQFTLPPGWLPPDFSAALVNPLVKCDFIGGEFEVANITFKYEKPATRDSSGLRSPSLHTLTDAGRSGSPTPSNKSASNIQRSRRASRPHSRNKSLSGQSVSSVTEDTQESEHLLSRTRSVHLDDEERANPSRDEPPTPKRSTVSPMDNIPSLLPIGPSKGEREPDGDSPPPVPPHRTPTIAKHGNSRPEPISTAPPAPAFGGRRRTSSPLKHEYDPSSPSNSDSEHAEEDQRLEHDHDDSSSSSSSSEDEESDDAVSLCSEEEDGDYPPPLLSIPRRISRQASSIVSSPRQRSSSAAIEDADVDNASELTPLARTPITPPQPQQPPPPVPQIGAKFRAFIFTWSTNQWEKVSPGECKVIITPGHIEVFPLTTSVPTSPGSPAVANDKMVTSLGSYDSLRSQGESIFSFDLTASLPVRRGTAVDISIRTPPSSKMAGASIMLRSRSPNECEMLYNTLNGSRNYPQHQLPPTTTISSQSLPSEMSNNDSSGGSIKRGFGAWARSKTYRAGASISTPSLVSSPSEASVNSISSAFSRFRAGKIFKNSPLGSAASSSSSMAGSSRGGSPIGLPNVAGIENSIVQMSPMKIRLYRRENASKWRDLGNARLNVLKPLEGQRGRSMNDDDKRIVIVNKKGTTVLLDVVLGESAFERVARTGIAVSILVGEGEEDGTGKPGDVGGIGAKSTVYMMQMKGEAEAAYSFSILGKLRY